MGLTVLSHSLTEKEKGLYELLAQIPPNIESYRKSKDNGSILAVSGRFVLRQITRHNAAFQTYRPETACKVQRSNQPALFCFLRRFLLECKNSGKKKS